MITIQTEYAEIVSRPENDLREELAGDKVELKKVDVYTGRGGQ
jgi:hypothetical protein